MFAQDTPSASPRVPLKLFPVQTKRRVSSPPKRAAPKRVFAQNGVEAISTRDLSSHQARWYLKAAVGSWREAADRRMRVTTAHPCPHPPLFRRRILHTRHTLRTCWGMHPHLQLLEYRRLEVVLLDSGSQGCLPDPTLGVPIRRFYLYLPLMRPLDPTLGVPIRRIYRYLLHPQRE